MLERSIFSAISGIVAVVGGILLFLFSASFLRHRILLLGWEIAYPISLHSIVMFFSEPVALSAMALYVIIAVACGLLFSSVGMKKGIPRLLTWKNNDKAASS